MLGKLTREEIDAVLESSINGRIGYTDGTKIYIVPVSYAYSSDYLVLHSKEGHKISSMRLHPSVCFEVDQIHDQVKWKSVVLWGEFEEIMDPKERYYAMKFLVSRIIHTKLSESLHLPHDHVDEEYYLEPGENRPVVYRIRIKDRSGRFEDHEHHHHDHHAG
ncbi:pyridoxamine 5'-phosphate oxidase [Chitinophaga caeni]|uniref:Pyridoxamine 5'-phosphate oxidase n=1 Tax=Chitinophaga caeni TaxID=2029983 RepID=A0A291QXN4_9BACT|nr:pyridoxamine 5'-phosphate oxidase family protein [Chitinophaga caeni]ATL48736.1 pyridoxamine 5'-phosphate oxidase [Chitinophaga caeni]